MRRATSRSPRWAARRWALAAACVLAAGCGGRTARTVATPFERVVTIQVRDRAGAPAAGAAITLTRDPFSGAIEVIPGTTDADGLFQHALAAGGWTVYAEAGADVAGGSFLVRDATGPPPADTALVRLDLDQPGVARGHAYLAGRANHAGTLVSMLGIAALGTTDPAGAWALGGVPPGRWRVEFVQFGFETALTDVVVAAPGDTATADDVTLVSES